MPDFSLPLEYYLIPFLIIVGICLILIVVFMVASVPQIYLFSCWCDPDLLSGGVRPQVQQRFPPLPSLDHQVRPGPAQSSPEPLAQGSAEETPHSQVQERYVGSTPRA